MFRTWFGYFKPFIKIIKRKYRKTQKLDSIKDVSIAITAMVNAHAKIIMHKHKLEILKIGGSIYY